jgi:hypothetical protein
MNYLNVIVEDTLSAAVMSRILAHCDFKGVVTIRDTRGNGAMRVGIDKYKAASRVIPHIVLTDLDRIPCAPELLATWRIGVLPETMLFRVVVREVEAWLMSDRCGIATYLQTALVRVPQNPEAEPDPKQTLFNLVRKSRKRSLIAEMVPQAGAHIGPMYNDYMCDFTAKHWNIEEALVNAPSLAKCINRISAFIA